MWRNFGQESGGGGIRPDERVAPLPSRIPRGHARQDAAPTLPDLREQGSVGVGNRNSYAVFIRTSPGHPVQTYLGFPVYEASDILHSGNDEAYQLRRASSKTWARGQ